ncbi:MAG: HD-GYP domain-containing protein [Sarcina sp.]
MRLIPIECIKKNCYLAKTLYDNSGNIFIKKGTLLTENLIKKIKEMKIYQLYIIDKYSSDELNDIISSEFRQKTVSIIQDVFENSEKIKIATDSLTSNSEDLISIFEQKDHDFKYLKELSEEIYHNILNTNEISLGLVDIKNMDIYTYQHSVNVAVLSVILGIWIDLSKDELIDLCIGALLHDIGKIFVGKKIIQKPAKLTSKELDIIKLHPKLGYDYIKDIPSLKESSKMIVLQHHERINGTGYPNGLKEDKINYLAKIVSIADVYDALTSDRSYKEAMSPSEAFEFILSNSGTMFDTKLTKIFSKIMVPYPVGTLVKLNDDSIGLVTKSHPLYPLRPTIKIIKALNLDIINKEINLSENLSITIKEIVYNI